MVVVSLLGVLAACTATGGEERPVVGGIYREGVVGQPLSLNPLLDPQDPIARDVARLAFAGLVRVTDAGEIQGDLADRWQTGDGGLTYVFHLREGALWHDGRPVIADDVLTTIAILQAPEYPGPSELGALWRRVRADRIDERTVRLQLDQPYSSFVEACSVPLLPSHVFSSTEAANLREHPASYLPIGAGPFRVQEVTPQGVRMLRHTGYQGPEPQLDEVVLRFFADLPSAGAALDAGLVDGLAGLRRSQLSGLDGERFVVHAVPLLGEQVILLLNHRNPILADRRVRQAIALGIDREQAIAGALPGEAIPAHGPVPSYSWAYTPLVETASHPSGARTLLDLAGWLGPGPRFQSLRALRLQLSVPVDPRLTSLAEEIRAQLQTLGIQVALGPANDLDLYREQLIPRRFDLALIGVAFGSVDPDPYPWWHSSAGFNFASYSSGEADRLVEGARLDGDPGHRRALLEAFQRLWVDEVPSIAVAHPVMTYVMGSSVRGVRMGIVPEPGARLQHVAEWYFRTENPRALLN